MPLIKLFPIDEFRLVCPHTVGRKAKKPMLIDQSEEIERARCCRLDEYVSNLIDHEVAVAKRIMLSIAMQVHKLDTTKCFCPVHMVEVENEFYTRRAEWKGNYPAEAPPNVDQYMMFIQRFRDEYIMKLTEEDD